MMLPQCTRDTLSLSHFGRAFDACHRLAKEGSPLAEYILGEMYNRGLGVPRDYSESLAGTAVETCAHVDRATAIERMPQKQIETAEQLIRAWKPTSP